MNYTELKLTLTFVIVIITNISFSQNKKTIVDSLSELTYSAHFADLDGNVTYENIIFKSLGIIWEWDKSQTKCELIYTPTDSIINQLHNPLSKRGQEKNIQISIKSTTGYIDNDNSFWIHPFRENQYVYTEIAPFPSVYYNKLSVGSKWEEKLFILFGWGGFKGTVKKNYEVISQETYNYQGETLEGCWLIQAQGKHNKLGTSTTTYLFHPKFGFLYIKYLIYNGIKMEFYLINKK